jgi:hypothetical protein
MKPVQGIAPFIVPTNIIQRKQTHLEIVLCLSLSSSRQAASGQETQRVVKGWEGE